MGQTTVFLIRHGESAGNASGRYQGQTDTPLTELGQRQAEVLADRLAQEPITLIYASDLSRARQTAEILAARLAPRHVPLILDRRLREIDFGEAAGMTPAEVDARWPAFRAARQAYQDYRRGMTGETYAELQARMKSAFADIVQAHVGASVALVTHGTSLRSLLASLYGYDLAQARNIPSADNTALSIVRVCSEHSVVELCNDVSHLKDKSLIPFMRVTDERA